jgi:DNA processing protein
MEERECVIALSLAGLYYSKPLTALYDYFGSFQEIFGAKDEQLGAVLGKSPCREHIIKNVVRDQESLKRQVHDVQSVYRVLTLLDDDYPRDLKQIYDPPWVLYLKGKPLASVPMIGIVGARKATTYGKWAAGHFARELAHFGVGVVSGLAYGIDAAGHQSCLEAGGYSVGVLGGGIDQVYPASNRSLYEQMALSGTIISEYGPGIEPQKHFFPARNRIISGLSIGVFVVEAGERSGALITADFAMEQGRDVFALPGSITSALSAGTNRLLRDGARMVLETEDLISPLRSLLPQELLQLSAEMRTVSLSEDELLVMNAVHKGPIQLEQLIIDTGLSVSELNGILTVLELKGLVEQHPGKRFTVR